MNKVTGWLALVFLVGKAGGITPDSGYCIGNECFTVFRDSTGFKTAQSQCGEHGGHLMTVRSSVSHDILQILLANFTGRFWIGLQLMSGCPDASAGLRGFQWVTKDSESDFTNWLQDFNGSCSSSRCVSVSTEDEFKWIQAPCNERAEGFLCEYSFSEPCASLEAAPGGFTSYKMPYGFVGEDLLSAPPGTIAIRMPSEATSICFSSMWMDAPWNCEINEGGCEYKCAVDPNKSPSCYCPPGQTVNPKNQVSCEKQIANDPCLTLNCQHVCYESAGSYACSCDHGFQLAGDGRSCVDFNDCADDRQCPGDNFVCVNTAGGFQCVCKAGYRLSSGKCADVDECASAPCEHICNNTPGGYTCSCYEGFRVDQKSPDKCELYCGKEECTAMCDPNDESQCFCPQGYILDQGGRGNICIDIDECAFGYCDHNCMNTFGGHVCSCSPGYTLIHLYKCVKNDDEDGDGGFEGSGATSSPDANTTPFHPLPGPTRRPSAVSAGGLVGIIVCTVFVVVLVVFVAHLMLTRRKKPEGRCAESC